MIARLLSSWVLFAFAHISVVIGLHAAPRLPVGAREIRDVPYVTNGHPRQKLDLYLPASPKCPLVVLIHGGGWVSGSKDQMRAATSLVGQGYSVASIGYRLSTDAIFPAQIQDCKAAIRWLRAHDGEYGYDSSRIGASGNSAGGHLVALLATTGKTREFDVGDDLEQSSAIQCGVDGFGPTDLPGFQPPGPEPRLQRGGTNSIFVLLLGGPIDEKLELARKASPVTWVSKDSAPLFIMHGTKDPLVPLEQSRRLADKLKAAGSEVTLEVVEGGAHGGPEFLAGDRLQGLMDFLKRHLQKQE